MKKKIAILGSTGSIGKNTINIFRKNLKKTEIILLSTNNNINELMKQQKLFSVKNLIIINKKKFLILKKKLKNKKINVYNDFYSFNKIFKKKADYVMSSITGLSGLEPTMKIIKYTKKIAIANKETLICAWNLVDKELKKNKTKFIPVDSEHFSIWSTLNCFNTDNVEKIYITASGGPLLNIPQKKIKYISRKKMLNHPSWSMGQKISIDSSTMMNKVFEIIEAQRIFNISFSKIKIVIHPKSYLHSIIKFKNGIIKLLVHETNMKIPIFNSIYSDVNKCIPSKDLNFKILNNLHLNKPNFNKFPCLNFKNYIPKNISLFETVLITANDEIVNYYLKGYIKYDEIYKNLYKILNKNEFKLLKKIKPKNLYTINKLHKYVRLKTRELCIR